MESLTVLLTTLNTLSPLAVIALFGVVILLLVKNNKTVNKIKGNDLHSIEEKLDKIVDTLQRMEVRQGEDFSWIKARINGKH